MGVLVSKRNLSRHEYVHTFEKIYQYTIEVTKNIAKRKQQWLVAPIFEKMNKIYDMVMQADNDYFLYKIKMLDNKERALLIIKELKSLQKPLLALWNIERFQTKRMVHWSDMINKEIKYIYKLIGGSEYDVKDIFILDYKAMAEMDFIRTMSEIHRMVYTKTISLPSMLRNSKGLILMDLADEALYRICKANVRIPTNAKMAEERRENLSIALQALLEMQTPMFSIFNVMGYSENTMLEWVSKLNKEVKLLRSVMKSDSERFKNL